MNYLESDGSGVTGLLVSGTKAVGAQRIGELVVAKPWRAVAMQLALGEDTTAGGFDSGQVVAALPATTFSVDRRERLMVLPFGIGEAGDQFSLRVRRWEQVGPSRWIPLTVCELACTLDGPPGDASAMVSDLHHFAGQISVTVGACDVVAAGSGSAAWGWVDLPHAATVDLTFQLDSAQAANALIAVL